MYVCCMFIINYLAILYTYTLVHVLVQRVIISMSKLSSLAFY